MPEEKKPVGAIVSGHQSAMADERGGSTDRQLELQIHLAEYQALTTRITYWITLQFSVIPITGGALLLLPGVGKLFPPLITVWATTVIMEIGIAAYLYTLYEMMSTGQYVECELASRVRKVMPNAPVWQFELYKRGNHVYSPAGIYLMTVPSIIMPFVALWLHWLYWPPLSGLGDSIGGVICLGLSAVAFMIARKGAHAQKKFGNVRGRPGNC